MACLLGFLFEFKATKPPLDPNIQLPRKVRGFEIFRRRFGIAFRMYRFGLDYSTYYN